MTPDNPRLDGAEAFVVRVHEWGAEVLTEAAAAGRYRAGWGEMSPAPGQVNGHAPTVRGGSHGGAAERGYTGDVCARCGSSRMRRAGTCLACENCGDTSGGCG